MTMADNFLSNTGLTYYHNRINTVFATKTEVNSLSNRVDEIVAEGGEPNVIEIVKVNGTALAINDKAVDVSVPTTTSQLTNNGDGTSNFATESYVNTNGGKIDKIKVNTVEQTIDSTDKSVNITIPTNTGDLTNNSGFITNAVENLTNYYLKTETYTQSEVDNLIGAITTLNIEVVNALPSSNISTTTIYLVPKTTAQTNNAYDEYVYSNNNWEKIGDTEIDLSGYWSTSDLTAITTAQIDALFA